VKGQGSSYLFAEILGSDNQIAKGGAQMRRIFRWSLFIPLVFSSYLVVPEALSAEPLKITASSQFLWGDDLLGNSEPIVAQYLRLQYNPEDSKFSVGGYGRIWYDFGEHTAYYENEKFEGRLYYLYLDYAPFENSLVRLGRQYVNFSGGSSILDGASLTFDNIGPVGITAAAGRDVVYSLDSEYSRFGNYFIGVDLHVVNVRSVRAGASFVLKYDSWDRAREEVGVNFRYIYRYASPYAEGRYDILSNTVDEVTAGVDFFPLANMLIKAEFYQSYPTFDSTSIFSVFAVDRFDEYLLRAEYSLDAPVTIFASYSRQMYQGGDDADYYIIGTRFYPIKALSVNASVEYRNGFGGNLWGFDLTGDYKINNKIRMSAGAQYNAYKRPESFDDQNDNAAQRYWLGGQYNINKNWSFIARIEDDIGENFKHRPLGRIALNWNP
jgi:hypothetical protein